jgi:hypothetical protein
LSSRERPARRPTTTTGHLDSSAEHTGWLTPELIDDFAITGRRTAASSASVSWPRQGVDEISTAYLNGKRDQIGAGRRIDRPRG